MKKKQMSTKLSLNKMTIAQLQHVSGIAGGGDSSIGMYCQAQCAGTNMSVMGDNCTFLPPRTAQCETTLCTNGCPTAGCPTNNNKC